MTRLTAGELADIHRNAMAEYENACGFVIGLRDKPLFPGDPFADDTRQRVTRLAQEIADILEWRVEQVEDMARGIAAQEKAETAAHYAEQARQAQTERRSRYDDSFAALHATGRCRSSYCCGGQQDTA